VSVSFPHAPEKWDYVSFVDAVKDDTGGNSKIKSSDYLRSGELPVIDQGQSHIGGFVNDIRLKCTADLPVVIFGDHTKALKFVTEPFALGADGVKVLSAKEGWDPKFLYHYLKAARLPDSAGYSRHFKFLKEVKIPVLPLEEQRRIAAILDKADAIRRKREEALRLADEFLRSTFLEMFGDPVVNPKGFPECPLEEIAEIQVGYPFASSQYTSTGIRLLRGANVMPGMIAWQDVRYWSDEDISHYKHLSLEAGDIVIAMDRPWISSGFKMARVENNDLPSLLVQRVARIHSASQAHLSFLFSIFRHEGVWSYFRPTETTIPHISPLELKSFPIMNPPLKLIEDFYERACKLSLVKQKNLQSKAEAERLFSSLSQRAFRGEL
jgi:type I restriction enzyme, S subunit